jgi:hypothetical protein
MPGFKLNKPIPPTGQHWTSEQPSKRKLVSQHTTWLLEHKCMLLSMRNSFKPMMPKLMWLKRTQCPMSYALYDRCWYLVRQYPTIWVHFVILHILAVYELPILSLQDLCFRDHHSSTPNYMPSPPAAPLRSPLVTCKKQLGGCLRLQGVGFRVQMVSFL